MNGVMFFIMGRFISCGDDGGRVGKIIRFLPNQPSMPDDILFQGLPLCLRHEPDHEAELQHHHDGEQQECIAAAEPLGYVGEGERDNRRHKPMYEAAQSLAAGAHFVREDLGDKHPDNGTLRERKEGDVEEQAERHHEAAEVAHIKSTSHDAQRNDKPDGADEHKLTAAEAIDHINGDERKDKIHQSGAGAGQERGAGTHARHFEDTRGIIDDSVYAGHLVEERHQHGEHDGIGIPAREQAGALLCGRHYMRGLKPGRGFGEASALQDIVSFSGGTFSEDEPAWAFRYIKDGNEE